MRLVFMGTPDFAVNALTKIVEAGHEVTLVVTQPDKPKGRGKAVQFSPVKEEALRLHIPVFQPTKIRTPEAIEILRKEKADVFIVAAFGQILSKEVLDMPLFGCINIHASLLPQYRGAAPIQWAIINGEIETGITIMQMDVGLDTGDMLFSLKVPILPDDTGESLHNKLSITGAKAILEVLVQLELGKLQPIVQGEQTTAYAKMLTKSMGLIDWNKTAIEIERLVRALNSWPSAYTYMQGKGLKIWNCKVITKNAEIKPGTVVHVDKDSFIVQTGNGQLAILCVQLEGKKKMDTKDFLLGNNVAINDILG